MSIPSVFCWSVNWSLSGAPHIKINCAAVRSPRVLPSLASFTSAAAVAGGSKRICSSGILNTCNASVRGARFRKSKVRSMACDSVSGDADGVTWSPRTRARRAAGSLAPVSENTADAKKT